MAALFAGFGARLDEEQPFWKEFRFVSTFAFCSRDAAAWIDYWVR